MLGTSLKKFSRTILPSIIAINSATVIIRHLYSISATSAAEYSAAASPLAARGATVLGGITTKPT